MALGGIAQVGNHVVRQQHVNRCADRVQASQNVQGVMLKAGKWAGSKQKVDRDAIGHRVALRHCRMLAKALS
jgi:hypothetical protein